jgi:protein TonB
MRIGVYGVVVVALVAVLGCGSSDTSEPEAVELEILDTPADGFQPFDAPPTLVKYSQPEYPESARKARLEGDVVVRVLVAVDGTVEEAEVLRSSDPAFDRAALLAAGRLQFTPASLEGEDVRSVVAVPFAFRLN